jgi:hypothetical protein
MGASRSLQVVEELVNLLVRLGPVEFAVLILDVAIERMSAE